IHPGQVAILNEEFSPNPDEVARAKKIVAAYAEAQKAGRGSFEVDGKMVDIPIVERARMVMQRHEAIAARSAPRPVAR
ncbi:MAG TPA: CoA ester lyase, partial [bacterium]